MSAVTRCLSIIFMLFILSGCHIQEDKNTVTCELDEFSAYADIIKKMLPDFIVQQQDNSAVSGLTKGAVETYEMMTGFAIENDIAQYWYPHYQATVVIAIDEEYKGSDIKGWRDLLYTTASVGISDEDFPFFIAAMSYGLEGNEYTASQATKLLRGIHQEKRLETDQTDAQIIICFDYQAAGMRKNGRKMQMIVPEEGTLTFEKGILSVIPVHFPDHLDSALLSEGFRLSDDRMDENIYPSSQMYNRAVYPENSERMNRIFENADKILRRDILRTHIYKSADGREHHLTVIILCIAVMVWTGYLLKRVLQVKIRRASILSSIFMILWVLIREFKWQIPEGTISRYCWYSYYLFQMGLALILLWMALGVDKTDDDERVPYWWKICLIINSILLGNVYTNDFHMLVFRMDLSQIDAESNYLYGPVYYLVALMILAEVVVAFLLMAQKSWKNPSKTGFLFPIGLGGILFIYWIAYILKVPFALQTDITIVGCLVVLLFNEICIRAGLIPVNTKYKELFTSSILKMKIINHQGDTVLFAGGRTRSADEDIITFSNPVSGGQVVWEEDIRRINQLRRDISDSIARLETANTMLEKEEQINSKRIYAEERMALVSELESEIEHQVKNLAELIQSLPEYEEKQAKIANITLLLCFIKRRCNLFFRQRESEYIPKDEWMVYLNELVEFAGFAEIKMHIATDIHDVLPTVYVTLFYEFLYVVLEQGEQQLCRTLLVRLKLEENYFVMDILPSKKLEDLKLDKNLLSALQKRGGVVSWKDLEETAGIKLSFPEEVYI